MCRRSSMGPLPINNASDVEMLIHENVIPFVICVLQVKVLVIPHRRQDMRDQVNEKAVNQVGVHCLL